MGHGMSLLNTAVKCTGRESDVEKNVPLKKDMAILLCVIVSVSILHKDIAMSLSMLAN